jgi:hypothetical protein
MVPYPSFNIRRTYLESGIYEISNLSTRNPLSIEQTSAADNKYALVDGARTEGNSPQIQQFMVMREPTSGAYLIQNVMTNQYVTSNYPSAAGADILLSKVNTSIWLCCFDDLTFLHIQGWAVLGYSSSGA